MDTVVLRKEMMDAEENVVKSFILRGQRKIGYISLPGFYTTWGEAEGSRCATDVAREIVKLKKENIEGLILDLRFNGGGSLQEAVSMAGIFIDAGPVGIIKGKNGDAITIKDINRGTVYDGPLVLLVNGMSASASEFLAAALQDHQRAVVIGSVTYGKASAQNLHPLDPHHPNTEVTDKFKPGTGYVSVTLEKIYRITGKTAQRSGVIPHIVLPDIYDSLKFREAFMPLALPYDSIFKKTYYQPGLLLPVNELNFKSQTRMAANADFERVKQVASFLANLNDNKPVSLAYADFKKYYDHQAQLAEVLTVPQAFIPSFTVAHHQFEMQRMQRDKFTDDFNKAWEKKLREDISLDEAFHIICDYVTITLRK
jgi:carboxyl-terminal processing protease